MKLGFLYLYCMLLCFAKYLIVEMVNFRLLKLTPLTRNVCEGSQSIDQSVTVRLRQTVRSKEGGPKTSRLLKSGLGNIKRNNNLNWVS